MTSLKGSSSTRDDVNENFNSIPSPTDETESALEKEAFIRVTSGLAASAWGSDKYPDLPGSFCNTGTLGSGQQRGIHCPYKSAFDSVQVVQSSIDGANKDDKVSILTCGYEISSSSSSSDEVRRDTCDDA